MMLEQDMTKPEAHKLVTSLHARPYIKNITYISKEQSLKEATREMGTDPSEFTNGVNPFLPSIELTLKSDYANTDSLRWVSAELKKYPKVSEITYQKDLIEKVNQNLTKIGFVWLVLAMLLTFVSFTLINNTIRLGIYARRFSIFSYEPGVLGIVTWEIMAVTGASVILFGIVLTALCAYISVNKFLRMKAGELYNI